MKNVRVLIIGANSCAGINFFSHAIQNYGSVVATSRSSLNEEKYCPEKRSELQTSFIVLDINKNLNELDEIIRKYEINTVINFASQSMVAESWVTPEDWIATNCDATYRLVKLIANKSEIKKFIHFSTPEVYGNAVGKVDEEHPFNPSTPYAATRALGDFFVKMWAREYGLPAIITRAANVYGPYQKLYRIIPKTFYSIMASKKIPLHGGGKTRRDFVHTDDINNALDLLIKDGVIGETYHIFPGNYISIKELVEKIGKLEGRKIEDIAVSVEDRKGKDLDYELSGEKMAKLGWCPKITIDEGLLNVRNWFGRNATNFSEVDLNYEHQK